MRQCEPSERFPNQILQRILGIMDESSFAADSAGKISIVNPSLVSLLDYKTSDLIGNSVNLIFSKDCPEGKWEDFWTDERLSLGIAQECLMLMASKRRGNIPVAFKGSVIRDARKQFVGIIGIVRKVGGPRSVSPFVCEGGSALARTATKCFCDERGDRVIVFCGVSKMQELMTLVRRVARTEAPVLIQGETGTGKELVARTIHHWSDRRDMPFIPVNCAAIPEGLLESELFGHEKGAFTGAFSSKPGRIEMAQGGTLFLDEVGDLKETSQAKLLRVLQEKEFERVGGTKNIKVNFRVIAATNKDLFQSVRNGQFREDLYYRLNVVPIVVPPLRDRREDLPLLVDFFLEKHCRRYDSRPAYISDEAIAVFQAYHWPGNIRELENLIERLVATGLEPTITPKDLSHTQLTKSRGGIGSSYHELVKAHKREVIREAISKCEGNVSKAAKLLDLQPTYLFRLIRKLEMN